MRDELVLWLLGLASWKEHGESEPPPSISPRQSTSLTNNPRHLIATPRHATQASFAGHDVRGQLQAQLAEMAKTEGGSVDLRAVFNKWDADGNGTLDRQEFEWMLDALTVRQSWRLVGESRAGVGREWMGGRKCAANAALLRRPLTPY